METTVSIPPAEAVAANVVRLAVAARPKRKPRKADHRFLLTEFLNVSGTKSFRVGGYKRDGTRIRENFSEEAKAKARRIELETEWLKGEATTEVQATKLTREQISLAEAALIRLGPDRYAELIPAVEHWLKVDRTTVVTESRPLDEAADKFILWLSQTDTLRPRTKSKLRIRVNLFRNSVANMPVADIGPDLIEKFLSGRKEVSALTNWGSRGDFSVFFLVR